MNFHRASPRFTTLTAPTIGLLISCMLLAGCGTGGDAAVSPEHSAAAEATSALPHGVRPPKDPPQPGDARLGPDGYYDYSAPDFELKNPCDMDIYQRALEKGWRPPEFGKTRGDNSEYSTCGLIREKDAALIVNNSLSRSKIQHLGYATTDHGESKDGWYTFISQGDLFEQCTATSDTPKGSIGISLAIGGFSEMKTAEETCAYVSARYEELIRGK